MKEKQTRVIIYGAGLAGASLALLLLLYDSQRPRRTFDVRLYDRFDDDDGVNDAGLLLHPNATRILYAMGLQDEILKFSSVIGEIDFYQGDCREVLNHLPNPVDVRRHGCPLLAVEKHALRSILHRAILKYNGKVTYKGQIQAVQHSASQVALVFEGGSKVTGDYLIGADGADSELRRFVDASSPLPSFPRWSNTYGLSSHISERMQVVLTGEGFIQLYPLPGGLTFWNIFRPDNKTTRSSNKETQILLESLRDVPLPGVTTVNDLISSAIYVAKSPLANISYRRTRARVCLIGDAAQSVLPFLWQGGAMAVEDAAVLATALIEDRGLPWYEAQRKPRVDRVRSVAYTKGVLMMAPWAIVRWVRYWYVLLLRGPERRNWLHDWRWQPPFYTEWKD